MAEPRLLFRLMPNGNLRDVISHDTFLQWFLDHDLRSTRERATGAKIISMVTVFNGATTRETLTAHFLLGGVNVLDAIQDKPDQPKYRLFSIEKRSGEERKIAHPREDLKAAQSIVKNELEKLYTAPECVHGFHRNRSIKTGASVHVGATHILKIDIKDFFNTITSPRVRGLLKKVIPGASEDFYRLLTDIICHEQALPQGSPCSPIISNMILYRMDREIQSECFKYKLIYTRYADDITISTKLRSFPIKFAYNTIEAGKRIVKLGPILDIIFESNFFEVKDNKTKLVSHHGKMIVTGLLVNKKLNLDRKNARSLRTIIHNIESSENHDVGMKKFYEKHFRKSFAKITPADIVHAKKYIRGRLYYLRHVKGDYDPTYRRLASRYKALDSKFNFDHRKVDLSHIKVIVRTEGTTDIEHLKLALRNLKHIPKYKSLQLEFTPITTATKGSSNMSADIKYESKNSHSIASLKVYLFDRDENSIIKSMSESSARNYKRHAAGLYSLVLPKIEDLDKLCIEYFYGLDQLKTIRDDQRRRLYLKSEFNGPWHPEEHVVCTLESNTLIADNNVFNGYDKQRACLRKGEFAALLSTRSGVNYDKFKLIFDEIIAIRKDFYEEDIMKN